ncbi:MAG: hypothetical protein CXT70_05125, partial [Methanobacteriota archaeon]
MTLQRIVAIILTAIIFLAPLTVLIDSASVELEHNIRLHADGATSAPDVPNYRIGDTWVYETQ